MSQTALIFQYDYGFLSELSTRFSIIGAEELQPFLEDVDELLAAQWPDYYSLGYRFGMLWQTIFDVKLE